MNKNYYDAYEVCEMLGIASSKAYRIIKQLNQELEEKGYITIAGKINKKYFHERTYGIAEDQEV